LSLGKKGCKLCTIIADGVLVWHFHGMPAIDQILGCWHSMHLMLEKGLKISAQEA
jgi:hypothetical protein